MKYYIIAGEASGDLHGANLIKALSKKDNQANCRAWGGDLMEAEGATLVKHYRDLAFMGFIEVVKNLKTILSNFKLCKSDILNFQPDVLILIDYPGFNLRMAKWAKANGIPVFYYISPQIWAWHTSRVHKIKKVVDRMFVILPFEKSFYQDYDYEVDFVGHPLLDVCASFSQKEPPRWLNKTENKPIIALMPGSRKQEIKRMLPQMLDMVIHFPNYQFILAGAPSIERSFYDEIIQDEPVIFVSNETYAVLHEAEAALVTSGTATLEAALFDVPQVVCYQGNALSFLLAKRLVKVEYISLVNLIADREVIKELIQEAFNFSNLKDELNRILTVNKAKIQADYLLIKEELGGVGASERAASLMYNYLNKK